MKLTRKQVVECYALARATIVQEGDPVMRAGYMRLQSGEFYEFICRLCLLEFEPSELVDLPLSEKLAYTLKDLLEWAEEEFKKPQLVVEDNMPDEEPSTDEEPSAF